MAKDRLITPSYCFILAANFLLYFGFWLLIPVLPFYLSEFFQAGTSTIGIVLSCYTVAALCIRPFSGYLLDTFARKPLYLFAYFIFMMMFGGYLIAGSLTYRDMRTMSVLANASVGLQTMQAKGINEQTARELLQPIVIDPLNNPWLNYSVYLNNTILPGILMLLIFMITAFSIGIEFKDGTVKEWLALADGRVWIAVLGKLLPHTVIFFIVGIAYDTWLYGVLHFPCHSGILPLLLATFLMVVASQAVGVTFFTLLPTLRLSLSACSLWGMLSFSISGFTYPVMAMHPMLQSISNLFPLRHYFLIYVNQMLNGYQMSEVWTAYAALCAFILLPVLLYKRLKNALINFDYIP